MPHDCDLISRKVNWNWFEFRGGKIRWCEFFRLIWIILKPKFTSNNCEKSFRRFLFVVTALFIVIDFIQYSTWNLLHCAHHVCLFTFDDLLQSNHGKRWQNLRFQLDDLLVQCKLIKLLKLPFTAWNDQEVRTFFHHGHATDWFKNWPNFTTESWFHVNFCPRNSQFYYSLSCSG